MKSVFATLVAASVLLAPPPAQAQTGDVLYHAIAAYDGPALAELVESEADPARAALARGVLAALHREDDLAIDRLTAAADAVALTPNLRRAALSTLSDVYMRHSRFADVAAAIEAARATSGQTEAQSFIDDTEQNLVFARALSGVAPMSFEVGARGETAITRDVAELARANVTINGQVQESVLDTGAGFSTISRSTAERLGLRILPNVVTVGSSTNDVEAHVAVADTLTIAGGTFHDVVFIVLPDAALSFGNVYSISAIVGLPVLMELGRLEFVVEANGEVLRHSAAPFAVTADANLQLNGVQPVAVVNVEGAVHRLRMIMDTGARSTNFNRGIVEVAPTLVRDATQRTTIVGGAGGMITDDESLAIPRVVFNVRGRDIAVEDVRVHGEADESRHGAIGQDLLRSGAGYVIDFNSMHFEVLPAN